MRRLLREEFAKSEDSAYITFLDLARLLIKDLKYVLFNGILFIQILIKNLC